MIDQDYIDEQRQGNDFSSSSRSREIYHQIAKDRASAFAKSFLRSGDSVLDVGCRTGGAMEAFQKIPNVVVVGIDLVPEFVASAANHGPVLQLDIESTGLESQSFDWLFCSHVLEHCRNLQAAWREMRRLAKKGIYLVLPTENEESFLGNISHHTFSLLPQGWTRLLDGSDFGLFLLQHFPKRCEAHLVYLRVAHPEETEES